MDFQIFYIVLWVLTCIGVILGAIAIGLNMISISNRKKERLKNKDQSNGN